MATLVLEGLTSKTSTLQLIDGGGGEVGGGGSGGGDGGGGLVMRHPHLYPDDHL